MNLIVSLNTFSAQIQRKAINHSNFNSQIPVPSMHNYEKWFSALITVTNWTQKGSHTDQTSSSHLDSRGSPSLSPSPRNRRNSQDLGEKSYRRGTFGGGGGWKACWEGKGRCEGGGSEWNCSRKAGSFKARRQFVRCMREVSSRMLVPGSRRLAWTECGRERVRRYGLTFRRGFR